MSFASSGQNSRILLYKFYWRSSGSPGGFISGGIVVFDGFQLDPFKMLIFFSASSLYVLTYTYPGALLDMRKWWSLLIL